MTNVIEPDEPDKPGATNAVWNMTFLMLSGFLPILVFSWQSGERFRTAAVGLLVAVATCLIGAAFGFIFGIPRRLEQEAKPLPGSTGQPASRSGSRQDDDPMSTVERRKQGGYRVNANLERISDWLGTVIVGVGLTQLTVLPGRLMSLAEFVGKGLGSSPDATVAAPAATVAAGAIIVSPRRR